MTPNGRARLAGGFYVLVILAGVASVAVRQALFVRGDAAATAAHIMASEGLYRLGVMSDLVGALAYVVVTALLYRLLRPAGRDAALVAAFVSLTGCAVGAAAAGSALAPLVLLNGAPFLGVFQPAQLQALALAAIRLGALCTAVSLLFFGVYCLLTGWLAARSGFVPAPVGWLFALAGACWLLLSGGTLLGAALPAAAAAPAVLGETVLALWLLLRGVDEARWEAAEAA